LTVYDDARVSALTADGDAVSSGYTRLHKLALIHADGTAVLSVEIFDALLSYAYQDVDVGGDKVGATATGLANDATVYTATIAIDGAAPTAIAITGSTAQTYTNLLAQLETDIGAAGASVSLVGGNLRFRSDGLGTTPSIDITDTDLFATLTDFSAVDAAYSPGAKVDLFSTDEATDGTSAVFQRYAEKDMYPPLCFQVGMSVNLIGTGTANLYYTQ